MSKGQILYNNNSGVPTSSGDLRFDDSTVFPNSRVDTVNLYASNEIIVNGQIGIATANPRTELEVSGYTILEGQGSDSQVNNKFGLNGSFDTLSITSPNGIGTGGRMSIFFGLASVTNYPIARIVAGDVYGRTTLAFQTGENQRLVERMRIDTNGYIGIGTPSPQYMLDVNGMAHITNNVFLNGESILYRNYTIPRPTTGTLYLNFSNVGSTSTTIDIQLSLSSTTSLNDSTMSKFTAFLSGYKGKGTGLYINNISVQTNGTGFFGPYNINTNTYDISGLSIQIDYINSPTAAAVNYTAYGPGAYKITQINITPSALVAAAPAAVAPDPPTNVQATGSPGQASVSWSAPTNNGGSDIVGYKVSWNGGSKIATSTSTTITGLNNGTTYTFTVIAVNTVGDSTGANSNSIFLASSPDPPTGVSAVRGNGQASLSWSAPANNGGVSITDYLVTYNGGSTTTGGTSITITGLSNGTPYTFTVSARNSVGSSLGTNSNSVTPATVPGQPQNFTAEALGSGNVRFSWSAPASNGGAEITRYFVAVPYPTGGYLSTDVGLVYTYVISDPTKAGNLNMGRVVSYEMAAGNSVGRGPVQYSNVVLIT